MSRLFGYLRVSTGEQVDHGAGLGIQRDAITAWAEGRGLTITDWYSDEGESGSNGIETRVELGAALAELGKGDQIVVYRIDRLARDLILQEQVLAEVWRKGARVTSCSPGEDAYLDPDDRSDPSRTLIRQVLGAVAQWERAMIAMRLAGGRRRKIAETGYGGHPRPYGWRSDGRTGIEPEPAEQAVLAEVQTWRDDGVTWATIAQRMTEAGVPKAGGGLTVWKAAEVHRLMGRATSRWGGRIPAYQESVAIEQNTARLTRELERKA